MKYQPNDIIVGSDGYYRVVADGYKGMRLVYHRQFIPGEIIHSFGSIYQRQTDRQPVQVGAGREIQTLVRDCN